MSVIRTSHSETVKSAMDFSTALCDAKGEIIAQGVTLPNQLGALPDAVAAVLREFGGRLEPGDVVMVNDPFAGGMHLPDIFVVKPVFRDDRLLAIVATVAHHADLGGLVRARCRPTPRSASRRGCGSRRSGCTRRGEPEHGVFALLRANTRVPEIVLGDMAAQIVACDTGERGLLALIGRYGDEEFRAQTAALLDYTEALTRAEIRTFPEGTYRYTDYLDDDGVHPGPRPDRGRRHDPGRRRHLDFEGSAPQLSPRSTARSRSRSRTRTRRCGPSSGRTSRTTRASSGPSRSPRRSGRS